MNHLLLCYFVCVRVYSTIFCLLSWLKQEFLRYKWQCNVLFLLQCVIRVVQPRWSVGRASIELSERFLTLEGSDLTPVGVVWLVEGLYIAQAETSDQKSWILASVRKDFFLEGARWDNSDFKSVSFNLCLTSLIQKSPNRPHLRISDPKRALLNSEMCISIPRWAAMELIEIFGLKRFYFDLSVGIWALREMSGLKRVLFDLKQELLTWKDRFWLQRDTFELKTIIIEVNKGDVLPQWTSNIGSVALKASLLSSSLNFSGISSPHVPKLANLFIKVAI